MSASNTGTGERGIDLLHDPKLNKSTDFTEAERQALGLVGLVPDVTESIETQLSRVLQQLKGKPSNLERFIHLMNLLETNETLFYRTYAFVDEFVDAVQEVFPNCCIHFEDWTGTDAIALLAR